LAVDRDEAGEPLALLNLQEHIRAAQRSLGREHDAGQIVRQLDWVARPEGPVAACRDGG
jgi:hypothetical protein